MRISVSGTGYLGATHAICMASLGHEVVGVDVDPVKVAQLSAGQVPFFEPGLQELLAETLERGNLTFSTSLADAARCEVHFIAVGTPQQRDSLAANMRFVDAAVKDLVEAIEALPDEGASEAGGDVPKRHIFVGKSTVPVGTAARLQELLPADKGCYLAWNPEFLREGHAVADTLQPDRIVIGADEGSPAPAVLKELYAGMECPIIETDLATAELVKVSANAFLATKISFINAVAEVCEATGADVVTLADAIGIDARIGRQFLGAGLGFGGGCLPKDIRAFMARAGELGVGQSLNLLREVDSVNKRRRATMTSWASRACGGSVAGRRIAVLGAAFKPNSDDVRDSPALGVAGELSLRGANVVVYDPHAAANAAKQYPTLEYAGSAREAMAGADVTILATEWQEFKELDPAAAREWVGRPIMLDGRAALDPTAWATAGWEYHCLGRGQGPQT